MAYCIIADSKGVREHNAYSLSSYICRLWDRVAYTFAGAYGYRMGHNSMA